MVERARRRRPLPRRSRRPGRRGSPCGRRRARPHRGSSRRSSPPGRLTGQSSGVKRSASVGDRATAAGALVADLARYLPGAFASRELAAARRERRPGRAARRRPVAPRRAGVGRGAERAARSRSSATSRSRSGARALRSATRADVVLDGFRPGVLDAARPARRPAAVCACSITGFGPRERHAHGPATTSTTSVGRRARGHRAGDAAGTDRRPRRRWRSPPCARSWRALERRAHRARRPARVSMTHGSHRLAAHRTAGDPAPHFLTGGLPATGSTRRRTAAG